ncbi:hypothetical protein CERZMDRAFT_100369 [Cercospora zeae-maydis SCOH1-5]|uniref:ATP-grasp domain-containing protein n=1 Tax=Cercospora zeae-maydis SCOH1-5 TaxID=717836 RepID=A0A6A6F7N8_9PEZI|nr:hypothetical protein CERZMDRAFT_100369 [Cercospora zeae-maydis SCOH1-5]
MSSMPNGQHSSFPPVKLYTTLHDLYLDGKQGPLEETLCVIKPNSDTKYGEVVPFNNKYTIHSAQVGSADDLAHLQMEINCYLLMFYAGPMQVVFIGVAEGQSDDDTLKKDTIHANAQRSFSVIDNTYTDSDAFVKQHPQSSPLHFAFALDFAQSLPYIHSPDKIYKLNSKRWLAECPLRSANDTIIDCAIPPQKLFSSSQTERSAAIDAEIARVKQILLDRPPYVLKLTQSLSSVGTLIVRDEKEREEVIRKAEEYLKEYLPRITKENDYLFPTSLILSDFIPGETMALNFFVKGSGEVVFLGACHQLSTGESGRQATAITFQEQEKLEKKYRDVLDHIGEVLHGEGYRGPCGADVMEDPESGRLFVIDLNVRSALSLVLYTLKDHLNGEREFEMALVYECVMLKIDRDEVEKKFAKEFESARLILMGSTRLGSKEQWAYGMILAGNDQDDIDKLSDRILEFEIEGGQHGDVADAAA